MHTVYYPNVIKVGCKAADIVKTFWRKTRDTGCQWTYFHNTEKYTS